MNAAYVRGLGFWSPGFAELECWMQRKEDSSVQKPPAALLEGPLRRRATPLTRMAVEVFEQAIRSARRDPAKVHAVWATAHGEHSTAIKLLEMMRRGEGKLSPTHFHNSVHNTAGGYASIATGNAAPSTTLTGGTELVASALFEAWCLLESTGRDVVLVLADEVLRAPFARADTTSPLALALLLSPESEGALGVLSTLRRRAVAALPDHAHFGHLHVGAALPLVEAIADGRPGTFALELDSGRRNPVWAVDLVESAAPGLG